MKKLLMIALLSAGAACGGGRTPASSTQAKVEVPGRKPHTVAMSPVWKRGCMLVPCVVT